VPALWHGALGLAVTAEVPVQWPDIVIEPKAAHANDQVVVGDGQVPVSPALLDGRSSLNMNKIFA
jgi:hypothetical protein